MSQLSLGRVMEEGIVKERILQPQAQRILMPSAGGWGARERMWRCVLLPGMEVEKCVFNFRDSFFVLKRYIGEIDM